MLDIIIKIVVLFSLLTIFYQDKSDRLVYWWLFLVFGLGALYLHSSSTSIQSFAINSGVNLAILSCILLLLWGYARFKMGSSSLLDVFGLGDVLFLIAITLGFPTIAFVILFVFGLLISLILHFSMTYMLSRKRTLKKNEVTVPLAGYLSLFFSGVYITHWLGFYDDLYLL